MTKNNSLIFIILAIATLSVASCKKDDPEGSGNAKLQKYITNHNITVTPTASGLYYIPSVEGTGLAPADTDFVLIKYNSTDLDGNFNDGTDKARADLNHVTPYFLIGGPFKIYMKGFLKGVTEGLKLMKEGGKATMIMPGSLAYNDYEPRIIEVELLKVIKDPFAYEKEQVTNLLDTAYHISYADSINSGIYYIEKNAGTGTSPAIGKKATIKFKAYFPDGRIFDQTDSENYTFTVGSSKAINGLNNGILLMKAGGKATFVIPYKHGFGFDQTFIIYNYASYVIVPYFSTVVYDVELVSVSD